MRLGDKEIRFQIGTDRNGVRTGSDTYLPCVIVVFLVPLRAEYYCVTVTRYTSQTLQYIRCVGSGRVTPQL